MRAAAAKGFINATDCADYLVKKGMPFRDAYKITGRLVAQCIEKQLTLETLPLADYQAASPVFDEDVYQAIALETCVSERRVEGGPSPEAVQRQIDAVQGLSRRGAEACPNSKWASSAPPGMPGAELVRLLLSHPHVELGAVSSVSYEGKPLSEIYPSLAGCCDALLTQRPSRAANKRRGLCLPAARPQRAVRQGLHGAGQGFH